MHVRELVDPRRAGYLPEAVVGRKAIGFVHPEDAPGVLATARSLTRGEGLRIECRIRNARGHYGWFEAVAVASPGDQAIARSVVNLREINGTRDIQERYRAVESSPVAIALTDAEGVFVDANPAFLGLTGYERDELLEMSIADITHPGDAQMSIELFDELRSGRRDGYRIRKRYVRKDGSIREADLTVAGLPDADGAFRSAIGVIQDVTEQGRIEREREESGRRLGALLKDVELIAMTLDVQGRVTFCNDHLLETTGWTREEALGASWFEVFLPPAERERVHAAFLSGMETGALPVHYENPIVTRDGRFRQVRWTNTVMRNDQGEIAGSASIGEDVTDRLDLEERLRIFVEHAPDLIQLNLGPAPPAP